MPKVATTHFYKLIDEYVQVCRYVPYMYSYHRAMHEMGFEKLPRHTIRARIAQDDVMHLILLPRQVKRHYIQHFSSTTTATTTTNNNQTQIKDVSIMTVNMLFLTLKKITLFTQIKQQ